MSDLFWPGDERAGSVLTAVSWLTAMEAVEAAWLSSLVDAGIAPESARHGVRGLLDADDVPGLAQGAEAGGNPVLGLVSLLRERLPTEPARWLHRGLTSQDVVDTGMMLCLRGALDRMAAEQRTQVATLIKLAERHEATPQIGRTLTQPAVPITFGLKVAGWLTGILDAADAMAAARHGLAVQVGGAAGTLAASTELARLRGLDDPPGVSWRLVESTAAQLGLVTRPAWHTSRAPFTTIADALLTATDAYGHIAADVTTLSRPEIGELAEGTGGGSSTMPHKRNPVLSTLIRRTALSSPGLAATVHLAGAMAVDERPDGAWHAEWAALRDLGRRSVVAASHVSDLLAGLRVDDDRMAANLASAVGADAEQKSMIALISGDPDSDYRGASSVFVRAAVGRARTRLEETT